MDEDLVKRLGLSNSTRGAIRLLAAQLPPRDEDLNGILDAVIASADEGAVTSLMLAMVEGGRTVEARLLPNVLPLLRSLDDVSAVSFSASGDVPNALVTAAERGALGAEREAAMLLIAGWLCLHREPRRPLPPGLISRSRLLAREARGLPMAILSLFALLKLTKNQGLKTVLEEVCPTPPPPFAVDTLFEHLIDERITNPLWYLPEQADRTIGVEGSIRRAVVKIGRNDPCSCGSGKKYKRCCFDADQERLKHSSDVAGVTRDELDATPEPYLTRERLDSMRAPKLARMHIEMIAHELQGPFLERLALFQLNDALLAAWEKVGWREDLSRAWELCLFEAVCAGRREVVVRLVELRGAHAEDDFVPLGARMMLLEDAPGAWIKCVEEAARRSLLDQSDLSFVELGYALVEGRLPGLGTLVARGAAAVAGPLEAMMLFESISRVRDRLDLPPEDPGDWILDHAQDFMEGLNEDAGEQLASAYRQIDAARAETRRLRVSLADARAQLDVQERLAARDTAVVGTPPLPPAAPEPSAPELRSRIEELKTALKERHDERNALRRELNEIRKASGTSRGPAPTLGSAGERLAAEPDREELALLGEEPTPLQRLRLPVFPSRFAATLGALPDHVGRAAIILIGKLAAGEPSAFVGMRRLRVRHEICRVRLATDYRLLFRLVDDRVEVLDLIRRRDFDRWLKTLG